MSNHFFHPIFLLLIVLFLASCGSVKYEELLLLDQVVDEENPIDSLPVLAVRPDDILGIRVASRDPENVIAFRPYGRLQEFTGASGEQGLGSQEGYRVDEAGYIYMPFLGEVLASGKSLSELRQEISDSLSNYIPDVSVQVRFLNFRVTVLGEVVRPNTYTIPNERLTVLEAIGMAGDFTPYAVRDEVLVIRQRNDVKREFARLNVQDKDLFRSPYFFLSPNDVIYVPPLEAKKYATSGDFIQRYAIIIVPIFSLLTFTLGTFVANK